jgi:hypothetical protein
MRREPAVVTNAVKLLIFVLTLCVCKTLPLIPVVRLQDISPQAPVNILKASISTQPRYFDSARQQCASFDSGGGDYKSAYCLSIKTHRVLLLLLLSDRTNKHKDSEVISTN